MPVGMVPCGPQEPQPPHAQPMQQERGALPQRPVGEPPPPLQPQPPAGPTAPAHAPANAAAAPLQGPSSSSGVSSSSAARSPPRRAGSGAGASAAPGSGRLSKLSSTLRGADLAAVCSDPTDIINSGYADASEVATGARARPRRAIRARGAARGAGPQLAVRAGLRRAPPGPRLLLASARRRRL